MGDFRITVEAIGGHGCGRGTEVESSKMALPPNNGLGYVVTRCRRMDCVDCLTIEFVERMKKLGTVAVARLEHWPVPAAAAGNPPTWVRPEDQRGPVDDLLTGTRDRPWR